MMIALALAALVAASDPDGVVTTAPGGAGAVMVGAVAPTAEARPDAARASQVSAQDLTTGEQIDRWLSARDRELEPFAEYPGSRDDRRMQGFVSGSIGTNDYASVAAAISLPIGEHGRLDLAYSQTRNGYGYGYGDPGYGYGDAVYGYPGDPVHGALAVPFARRALLPGGPAWSGRSLSLGFRWDEDKDRRDRPMSRTGRIAAPD